ncbi:MAG: hypothetical protein VB066_01885 [Paludibacter sp.]|nr:hypothetical protein [Paludibacter sp.]
MNKPAQKTKLPSFETIEQLMSDPYLNSCAQKLIDEMNADRNRVSEGGTKKLKASPVEFLVKMNCFTAEYLTKEYVEIHYKRTVLSSAIRKFITLLIQECVSETFKHYQHLYQKQQRKTTKTKQS